MQHLRHGAGVLRLGLSLLAGTGAAGCDAALERLQRGDAGWYTWAMTQATDFDAARDGCQHIEHGQSRDDCLLGVMEQHGRLAEADCALLSMPIWHEECLFLLAERQRAAGDLATGISTCHRTRYRRSCSWHLLQDEAEASLSDPPAVAEARLGPFSESDPLPDAAFQFWMIRFREGAAAGRQIDEVDCDGLRDPASCRRAFGEVVWRLLESTSKAKPERVCALPPGERVRVGGQPAWAPGPQATELEARWTAERCP